jgi:choline dehydrogenase-like flavoprotein
MISDADTIEADALLECDICIIGAGAAGISIALQFCHAQQRVIVLESGGETPEPATQALYEAEIADTALHSPADRYRERRFGGSTTIWGGRCVPFDPIDFADRPWMSDHRWPITYEDVAAYYPAANALCEAGEYVYNAAEATLGGMRPMIAGFQPAHFSTDTLERFSCPTNFAARYRHRLATSGSVQVLLHANCTELLSGDQADQIGAVAVRSLSGRAFTVRAKQVVLATGGLEVPRLLLASNRTHAAGIGNINDMVGRFYMCHIAATLGTLRLDVPRDAVHHGYEVTEDGTYVRRRLALTAAAQQENAVGNAVLRLHFPSIPDPAHRTGPLSALYLAKPFISYEYSKRLHGGDLVGARLWLRHVANVVTDPVATAGFLFHWVRRRTLAARKFPSVIVRPKKNMFSLDYHSEQQPDRHSRVTLSGERDALGMTKLRVDWRYTALDVRTASVTLQLLAADLARWGHGSLVWDASTIEQQLMRDGAYGGHHIGTARMSRSPATGVVDTNCRVHGMQNLFVAGSAIFPTSSQANPTLTIVALALRLADHLRGLKKTPASTYTEARRAADPVP